MSLFRATMPADVLLYHGRGDTKVVRGMEWLAFEAEHAMMFARREMRPPGWNGPPGGGRGRDGKGVDEDGKQGSSRHESHDGQRVIVGIDEHRSGPSSPFEDPEIRHHDGHRHEHIDTVNDQEEDQTGYLHHYRTLHKLNLLYIDGMSAGKTTKGTLDTQDFLLRNNSNVDNPSRDIDRAIELCNLAQTTWDGKIDGFIRMECGFEVLLCEFEGNVRLDRVQPVRNEWRRRNATEETGRFVEEANFRIYKAVSDRFWDVGENRAEVDSEDFVTVYSKGELELFEKVTETGEKLPRLRNVSDSVLEGLKDEVTDMVHRSVERDAVDWQKVSDMYVQRYANPLQALLLSDLEIEDFRRQLGLLLWIFASDSLVGGMVEGMARTDEVTKRCTDQFLPRRWNDSLAGRAVQSVASRLCGTLTNILFNISTVGMDCEGEGSDRYAAARKEVEELVSWLDWPVWRYCSPGCALNEVCVLPIWPIAGTVEDRKRPSCKNATVLSDETRLGFNNSYWHGPGDRTGPPNGKPGRGRPPPEQRGPQSLE